MDQKKDSHNLDVLGIKPIGDSFKIATQAAVDGASAFLGRICLPAAEEFGLALRDRGSEWRKLNMVAITEAAEEKLRVQSSMEGLHAHPKIVCEAMESGSWVDDAEVQDMWAGLLASSCTEEGTDDSNLLFLTLMSQITRVQARILADACERVLSKRPYFSRHAFEL